MKNILIESIIKNRTTCYFISPHYDDAVLSAGALLSYLSKHTNVIILTVFTKAGPRPYSLSAKAYVQQCGYTDAEILYAERKKEDKLVLGKIAKQVIDLDFTDALWRKKYIQNPYMKYVSNAMPELSLIYPTYKLHVSKGKIAKADSTTFDTIQHALKEHITENNRMIFCPAGIGGHVDHILVRNICEATFSPVVYWSDFPYDQSSAANFSHDINSFTFEQDLKKKYELIEGYRTQFKAMFANGLKLGPEKFYTVQAV